MSCFIQLSQAICFSRMNYPRKHAKVELFDFNVFCFTGCQAHYQCPIPAPDVDINFNTTSVIICAWALTPSGLK